MESSEATLAPADPSTPHIVATTEDLSRIQGTSVFYKSLEWSQDGTTILTAHSDKSLRVFIPPPDLLTPPSNGPHILKPYQTYRLPEPPSVTAIHPSYDLRSPSSCVALVAMRNLPLRLVSTLYGAKETTVETDDDYDDRGATATSPIVASYLLVSPTTEEHLGVYSLEFGSDGNWFYAGTERSIAAFDLTRSGDGPLSLLHTQRSTKQVTSSMGVLSQMQGYVSDLSLSSEKMLAAGTFARWVGLYNSFSSGGQVSAFCLDGEVEGQGVTQVKWSSCGRYICVAERKSDGVSLWDIRGQGKRLAWMKGRMADTWQRMGIDVFGSEVWAGGTDGAVRVWDGLGTKEGDVMPSQTLDAHGDAVSGVGLHSCGSVLATCSGQRHDSYTSPLKYLREGRGSSSDSDTSDSNSEIELHQTDSSMKIWAL